MLKSDELCITIAAEDLLFAEACRKAPYLWNPPSCRVSRYFSSISQELSPSDSPKAFDFIKPFVVIVFYPISYFLSFHVGDCDIDSFCVSMNHVPFITNPNDEFAFPLSETLFVAFKHWWFLQERFSSSRTDRRIFSWATYTLYPYWIRN